MPVELDTFIQRIDFFMKLIGMSVYGLDGESKFEHLKYYWKCYIHLFSFNLCCSGAVIWLVIAVVGGATMLKITYLIPCLTLCILGNCKVYYYIHHGQHVNELIACLRNLHIMKRDDDNVEKSVDKIWFKHLKNVCNLLILLLGAGVAAFAIGPLVITASIYYTSGELKFFLPFIVWYPFDAYNIRTWPFVYLQQLWTGCVAILSVYGPDSFFFTCCTVIHTQFLHLHQDMENIVKKDSWRLDHNERSVAFKNEIVNLVDRHRDLIRCVKLLDIVYSKSTLMNFLTSSLIICATGFNLMALQNYVLMAPFCAFLSFGMLQIFCYCYYGDNVMRSSMGIGDAIYNSRWYETGAYERKYLLTVLMRSQKPCRLTAYGFADVNLGAFTRILSSSWSYFALLNQVYHD